MHATLQDELTGTPGVGVKGGGGSGAKDANAMKTLNLRLDEVAHIRSVLTKAELESLPLDGNVRENVEKGKVMQNIWKVPGKLFSEFDPQVERERRGGISKVPSKFFHC